MQFTADQVWGLAVAADRINGGYVKEEEVVYENQCRKVIKEANKVMVKTWLRTGAFSEATEADIEQGREYRKFFNGYTLKALMGGLSDFDRQALRIAQMDEFTGKNMLEFAIISCLPQSARREQERTELKRELFTSVQLEGNIGEVIRGDIEVVGCSFSSMDSKFKIKARMGEAFVDFWFGTPLDKGATRTVQAKIKAVRGDKTTALNYVKIRG
jgi:hypothetical protein